MTHHNSMKVKCGDDNKKIRKTPATNTKVCLFDTTCTILRNTGNQLQNFNLYQDQYGKQSD